MNNSETDDEEKETVVRPVLFAARVLGLLAQTVVLFLAVPVLLIRAVASLDLPAWLTTTLTAIGYFGYLYALIRWLLNVADRLNGPTARARYRRRRP
jgi:hypothetical protein